MRAAQTFKVLSIDQEKGEVVLKWNNGIIQNHRIPPEYETARWTELQLRTYLSNEAPDVPDMPQFLLDELATKFAVENARLPGD